MNKEQLKRKLFQELCLNYSRDLQIFIYSLTRQDQYAMEEIYQNTMVQALHGLKNLKDQDKMKSWLFSIAKAEASRHYAKNQQYIQRECNDLTDEDIYVWEGIPFEDFTQAIDDKEFLLSLFNRLNEEEHRVFALRYIYDVSLKEISEILHINYSTVRSLHARGLAKCKKMFEERMCFYEC